MKIIRHKRTSAKENSRKVKKARIRKKISGSLERPRLAVFRSLKHFYGQIIDDGTGQTLAHASSLTVKGDESGRELAKLVGKEMAKIALQKNIKSVVFDRGGYVYHGRVAAFAEGAREGGLEF